MPDQYQTKSITSTGQARAMIDHNEHAALQRIDPPKSNSAFEHQKPKTQNQNLYVTLPKQEIYNPKEQEIKPLPAFIAPSSGRMATNQHIKRLHTELDEKVAG